MDMVVSIQLSDSMKPQKILANTVFILHILFFSFNKIHILRLDEFSVLLY